MAAPLFEVRPIDLRSAAPQVGAIMNAAFDDRAPHGWDAVARRHAGYSGAIAFGAFDTRGHGLIGFAYGYDHGESAYWADLIRPHLQHAGNLEWLDDAFELAEIAVFPEWQGRGVGRALFSALSSRIGRRRILLGSDNAIGWWQRQGFQPLTEPFNGRYMVMGRRTMKRTTSLGEHEIARIGLGTNRLRQTPANVAFIEQAVAAGVQMIDTAHTYAGGDSERTIGEALAGAREGVVVATKGGFGSGEGRPDVLRAQVDESLRRLRTNRIDLYYLHRVDPETPLEDSLATLREYVEADQIAAVGLSEVSIEQIERARAVVPIAAVQNRYSLGERQYDDVVDYCEREGIVFVPFFPLHSTSTPRLGEIASHRRLSEQQVALAWLLHRSAAMLPIPGTLSIEHVRDNMAALDVDLSHMELEALG